MTKARDLANASSAFSAVTAAELLYIDGVTSGVQTQLNSKLSIATASSTYVTSSVVAATYETINNVQNTYVMSIMGAI